MRRLSIDTELTRLDDPLGVLPAEQVPHHALLDARLPRDLCEGCRPD
ncbi:hypothetical protein [Zestomonas thermotolerans]|nr:hypothetical protein [Pseudomonas thermotolerans]